VANVARSEAERKDCFSYAKYRAEAAWAVLDHVDRVFAHVETDVALSVDEAKARIFAWLDRHVDPEIFGLVQTIPEGGISTYELVWRNLATIRELIAHNPGLVFPWLGILLKYREKSALGTKPFGERQRKRLSPRYAGMTIRTHLDPSDVMSSRAWRYLATAPLVTGFDLYRLSAQATAETFHLWLETLAEIGEHPHGEMLVRIYQKLSGDRFTKHRDDVVALLRAAFRRARQVDEGYAFYEAELMQVLDWFVAETPTFDANQRRAPWSWFMRQQEAWHEQIVAQAVQKAREKTGYEWPSLLDEYETQGLLVMPLSSTDRLVEESARLHHCVSTYELNCKKGTRRIFSIRLPKTRQPLATLEIVYHTAWGLNQVRGERNALMSREIQAIAEDCCARYNAAWQEATPAERARHCTFVEIKPAAAKLAA
jgi:hypothetical protein